MEDEVKTIETKIHVRIAKLEVGTEPLVVIHVETKKTIIEEIDV
jgi:hypothetical protein